MAHDEVATMLSGKLSVTLTVSDKDGDTVSASKDIIGSITFDDDGPKANRDLDCVTEGDTEGEPNYASGNVVTGVDGGLATDANGTDGNADAPGVDGPYTISKITHDGVTHELSVDGQTVSNLGADDGFDPTTGILTIKTAEGGTFEIVMISDDQSKVGDDKYTVPGECCSTSTTSHAGPEDAGSESGERGVQHGRRVDVVLCQQRASRSLRSNGNLDIKDINVSGWWQPGLPRHRRRELRRRRDRGRPPRRQRRPAAQPGERHQ